VYPMNHGFRFDTSMNVCSDFECIVLKESFEQDDLNEAEHLVNIRY
jgi:hypothetical protein